MDNKRCNNCSPKAKAFFADVRGCRSYLGTKKIVCEGLIFLATLAIGFFVSWIWLIYLIYVLRKPIMKLCRWTSEMNIESFLPPMPPSPQPTPVPPKSVLVTDLNGDIVDISKKDAVFVDWNKDFVQVGQPFHDKRGNWVQWGSPFYDNRDNLVQWGSPFYDANNNLVFPQ